MKPKFIIPEIPLCTNIIRLQSYLLSPDEVVLFDWFVVKQISFKYKDFHYSQARIEEETRIKRTRQDVIIKHFCKMGFLTTEVKKNPATSGKVRYFSVHFSVLAHPNMLCLIINNSKPQFKDFMEYMAYHAGIMSKSKQESQPKKVSEIITVDQIHQMFEEIYERRRILYNNGELTGEMPDLLKSATQLSRSKNIDKRIAELAKRYRKDVIGLSFTAYTDQVLRGKEEPRNFLSLFLTYSTKHDTFDVFDYHLNFANLFYGEKRKHEYD